MENVWIHICIGILVTTLPSKISRSEAVPRKARSRDDFVRVVVPNYVREGSTAFLKCVYDVDNDKLYSLKWYKGSQEFFRFTPKESPPVKIFPAFGGHVDMNRSNFSDVVLTDVNLNLTDKYTCEVTKDFPDYTTSLKTGKMTVFALPKHKPIIMGNNPSVSIGDIFTANCTSTCSKPIASITWMLNSFPVGPNYLTPAIISETKDSKESVTVGLNFTVRPQHFIRGRMTLTCHANIQPDLYSASTDVVITEYARPEISSSVVNNYSSQPVEGNISPNTANLGSYWHISASKTLSFLQLFYILRFSSYLLSS